MDRHQGCAWALLAALIALPLQAADVVPAAIAAPVECAAESPGAGMAGDVVLQYKSGAGQATDIRIVRSSGVAALDKAAVLALARCQLPEAETAVVTVEYRFGGEAGEAGEARPVLTEAVAVRVTAVEVRR